MAQAQQHAQQQARELSSMCSTGQVQIERVLLGFW
jgi:hypothetical protein